MAADKELMQIVKGYLNITWTDTVTENRLSNFIENGISDLDAKSGIKNDYIKPGKAQSLLLVYVMYARDGMLHEFGKNYKTEINAFINNAKVKKYASEQAEQTS